MPRYETLQAKAMRKLSPGTLNRLPSPVLMQGQNEMAKHIQRTYRTRNKHATYRKGSRMTKFAMRRQLHSAYANPFNNINDILNKVNKLLVDEYNLEADDENQINRRNSAIRYIIDNLERPLLEKLYNITWDLQDDEEDRVHINNLTYFLRNVAGIKSRKRLKKRIPTKRRATKRRATKRRATKRRR